MKIQENPENVSPKNYKKIQKVIVSTGKVFEKFSQCLKAILKANFDSIY